MPGSPKIFCISLPRTGTTSFTAAMDALGIPAKHVVVSDPDFKTFTAFADTPVWCDYPALDRRFPGSYFIYLDRDLESWLDSVENSELTAAFDADMARMRGGVEVTAEGRMNQRCYHEVFQSDRYRRAGFRAAFLNHRAAATAFMQSRPGRSLILPLGDPDSWPKLVNLLAGAFPMTFPQENRRRSGLADYS